MRTKTVRKNKKLILLISVVAILILALTAGTTLAWLKSSSGPVVNTFTPAKVTSQVEEDIDGAVKRDVKIKNTSNIDAYIRATVVINWVDAQGNVAAQKPVEGTDYKIEYNLGTNGAGWWKGNDGYYYYSSPVSPLGTDNDGDLTGILINSCQLAEGAQVPDGYSLSVEIIADAIQSVPTHVVEDNWHVTVNDGGTISKKGN